MKFAGGLPAAHFPLLPRKKNADKSAFGHTLVLAGSPNMTGAARLAGEACLKSGAGLVTLGVPRGIRSVYAWKNIPELMCLGLPENKQGALSLQAHPKIISFIRTRRVNCMAVGPGLTHEADTAKLVQKIVKESSVPVVLDADGINCFRGQAERLKARRASLVLTPHRGEFERLFSERCPENETKQVMLAKRLSKLYKATLVLKGHRTLVVNSEQVYRNRTGNPGMAKGGSGDVLTGMLAAFIAQGLRPFQAACWAVYFHGKAGDLALREKGELSLMPGDIIQALPRVFKAK